MTNPTADKDEAEYCVARGERPSCGADMAPLAGLFGGALWPLYWSWEIQE